MFREWKAFILDTQFMGLSRKFKEDFRFRKHVCLLEVQPQSGTCKPSQQNGKGSGEGHRAVSGWSPVEFAAEKSSSLSSAHKSGVKILNNMVFH